MCRVMGDLLYDVENNGEWMWISTRVKYLLCAVGSGQSAPKSLISQNNVDHIVATVATYGSVARHEVDKSENKYRITCYDFSTYAAG